MYDEHYGLSARPFQLTPDPAFWFDSATHRKAMAYLGYGLSQGEGFIVITGDPGAGKTTLIGQLMATIDEDLLNVIKIVTSQIEAEDLLRMVASGLNVDASGLGKAPLLNAIERGLHAVAREGRRTLLIVDEAQALSMASVEELRMLSNFQAGGHPLLQIFLLGQSEFRERLVQPDLEQLRQRVIAMHQLDPMEAEELEPYLIHRLTKVGWTGNPQFSADAVAAIHRWTGGVPRKVNQLAGRVMLFGAIEQIDHFTAQDVEAVIADLEADTMFAPRSAPVPPREAMTTAAAPSEPVAEPASVEAEGADEHGIATVSQDEREDALEAAAPYLAAKTADDEVDVEVEPAPEAASGPDPEAEIEPQAEVRPTLTVVPDAAPVAELVARVKRLEDRLEEQDAALRRVLTLMVDFIENEESRAPLRGTAA